jgi:hypothetical protein
MDRACGEASGQACQQAVVQAIDQERAIEGVKALSLPLGYNALSTQRQLLVLADLERVDRGLPGFTGLSARLDGLAEKGALSKSDPIGPPESDWGSNWAGGEASALLADYDWMYDDGAGSPNVDCASAPDQGCWAHRRNILADYGPRPSMGAAFVSVDGMASMAQLFSSASSGRLDYSLAGQGERNGAPGTASQPGGSSTSAGSALSSFSNRGHLKAMVARPARGIARDPVLPRPHSRELPRSRHLVAHTGAGLPAYRGP